MSKRESSMGRWRTCTRTIVAGALLAVVGVAVVPEVAQAEVNLPPDPSWVTNVSQGNNRDDGFKVKAMVKLGNVVYIGGGFTQIAPDNKAFSPSGGAGGNPNQAGIDQPYLFAVNATTGAAIQTFRPKLNGPVEALEVGPNNTLYVGGTFTIVNGVPLNGFAILDGSTGLSKAGITQRSLRQRRRPGQRLGHQALRHPALRGRQLHDRADCGRRRATGARWPGSTSAVPRRTLDGFQVFLAGAARCRPSPSTRPTHVGVRRRPVQRGPRQLRCSARRRHRLPGRLPPGQRRPRADLGARPHAAPPGPGGVVRDSRGARPRGLRRHRLRRRRRRRWSLLRLERRHGRGPALPPQLQHRRRRPGCGHHAARATACSSVVTSPGSTPRTHPSLSAPNARCQMFSVTTGAGHAIQATPNTSNGGHYGPFAVLADT